MKTLKGIFTTTLGLLVICTPVFAADVTSGLIHKWDFNESNGQVLDQMGTINGTLQNGATRNTTITSPDGSQVMSSIATSTVEGSTHSGTKLDLNYNYTTNLYGMAFPGSFTVSAWIQTSIEKGSRATILSTYPGGGFYWGYFDLRLTRFLTGELTLDFGAMNEGDTPIYDGVQIFGMDPSFWENQWLHVVARVDAATDKYFVTLYKDGVKVTDHSGTVGGGGLREDIPRWFNSGNPVNLGCTNIEDAPNYEAPKYMDNVRIYNRVLTGAEVVELNAFEGSAVPEPGALQVLALGISSLLAGTLKRRKSA